MSVFETDSSKDSSLDSYDSLSSPGSTNEASPNSDASRSLGSDSEALQIAPYSYEPSSSDSSESEGQDSEDSSSDHESDRLSDTSW